MNQCHPKKLQYEPLIHPKISILNYNGETRQHEGGTDGVATTKQAL